MLEVAKEGEGKKKMLAQFKGRIASTIAEIAEIEKLSLFLQSPFEVSPAAEWTDVAAKLYGGTCRKTFPCKRIKLHPLKNFGVNMCQRNMEIVKAIYLTTTFGSTYVRETSFSKMNFLKNQYRSRLTAAHSEDTLRISCSPRKPNFKKLAQDRKCNFSH
ncbi:hypothetical protein QE152_g14032 [Popillia japonica]|uniref:HAT C-terminal dimerisation domain-containing protein n=1 Tax=Popillia japonica TaxID=7064 RepID=A0AAW1HWV1_POPJA